MNNTERNTTTALASASVRTLGTRLFLGFLGGVVAVYGIVVALHLAFPRKADQPPDTFLERCREICLSYGLVPTGHVANDAQAYLAVAKPQELAAPLQDVLADRDFKPVASQSHPLLGKAAPEIRLVNDRHEMVSLQKGLTKGPVIVVFYYGYGCSHCVAQLFGLQKDLAHFRELGAEVMAISPDSPEHTAKRFTEYGRFDFPVLSDANNAVAEAWGVFQPATKETQEDRLHGTFLVDRNGKIIFADRGYKPFLDNKSLLFWLSGRAPLKSPILNEGVAQKSEGKP